MKRGPLSLKLDVEKLGARKFDIKVYVINTLDEEVSVEFNTHLTTQFLVLPGEHSNLARSSCAEYSKEDKQLFKNNASLNFEPEEEKLLIEDTFKGKGNYISQEYNKKRLPNGNYTFAAFLMNYKTPNCTEYKYGGEFKAELFELSKSLNISPLTKISKYILVKFILQFPMIKVILCKLGK